MTSKFVHWNFTNSKLCVDFSFSWYFLFLFVYAKQREKEVQITNLKSFAISKKENEQIQNEISPKVNKSAGFPRDQGVARNDMEWENVYTKR